MHKADRFEEWDPMKHEERVVESQGRPTPETEAASGELSRLLERSIESLPQGYRAVVMLRDVEGMSTAETAECLSMTEDNVKVRLHRAHAMLRKELFAKASLSTAEAFPFHAPRCDRMVAAVFARLGGLRGVSTPHC
jgi:RNA polymerase sigma-70 factor (ECF subfamily)